MENVVVVENLLVRFEEFTAVNNVSFTVGKGEVRGVLGGNGAGKSTTLRTLGGVIRPTSGNVTIGGESVETLKGGNKARALTGYCPDVGGLISGATPLEHVRLLAALRKDKDLYKRGLDEIERFNLGEFKHSSVAGFSHGMMRRLSVLLASLSAKSLLILDEPYDGVDPLGVDIINDVISEKRESGVAVIVSTHLQNLLVDVSDSINIMSKGELLGIMPAYELTGLDGMQKYSQMLVAHQNKVAS
jgi:ABC-2 type transport system ATP-binding protein